jgi:flagellar assembly protein FliH
MALKLEVFEVPDVSAQKVNVSAADFEEMRLAAFEKGYTAGWDDAVAAQDADGAKLRADLARNLEDLSFTYAEARAHVLQAMEPLLRDMVAKVLPTIAQETLAPVVLETLRPLAEEMAGAAITVVVNPVNRHKVETMLSTGKTLPLTFVEEPSLGEGQVYLRMGDAESRIDLDGVIAAIGRAVAGFFAMQNEVKDNE